MVVQLFVSPCRAIFNPFQFPELAFTSVPQAVALVLARGSQPLFSFLSGSYSPHGDPCAQGKPFAEHRGRGEHQLGPCRAPQCWLSKLDVPVLPSLVKAETITKFHVPKSKILVGYWTSHQCLDESDSSPALQGWCLV